MQDHDSFDRDTEEKSFIKERTIQQPFFKRYFPRLVKLLLAGIIFGVTAMLSAVIVQPYAKRWFSPPETPSTQTISIPRDNPETTAPPPTTEETKETEQVEDIVQSAIERYEYSVDDLTAMYQSLTRLALEGDRSIAAVRSVRHETDWFDQNMEKSGIFSGILFAETDSELLLLVPFSAAMEADSILVKLYDGTELPAAVKRLDPLSNLCVLSLAKETLTESTLKQIRIIPLGNSYTIRRGDILLTIGSPLGNVYSSSYGTISYIASNVSIIDGSARFVFTDAALDAAAGTFVINTSGALIGWAGTMPENGKTAIWGISDFKNLLERMSNGKASPYIGLVLSDISARMKESGIPEGIYVLSVLGDSPAYNAGIQPGDIITAIGSTDMHTISDFKTFAETLHAQDSVTIKVLRNSIEDYKEIEFSVTIGAR